MRGDVFRLLRELVEVAEDNGQLFWSLNVSAVLCHGLGVRRGAILLGTHPSQLKNQVAGRDPNRLAEKFTKVLNQQGAGSSHHLSPLGRAQEWIHQEPVRHGR